MTYDVEESLAAVLRQRAEHDVDARALLDGALVRGRRRQRGRRLAAALGGAGVAGLTTVALLTGPLAIGRGGPEVGTTGSRATHPVPGVTDPTIGGAFLGPGQVGNDPSAVHFALDRLFAPVSLATWNVGPDGIETLRLIVALAGGKTGTVDVYLAAGVVHHPLLPDVTVMPHSQVSVEGRRGRLTLISQQDDTTSSELRWSPVDGIEAVVRTEGVSAEETLAIGRSIRFDRTTRCVTPAQVTVLPPGATLTGCRLALSNAQPAVAPSVTLTAGDRISTLEVSLDGQPIGSQPDATPLVAGRSEWSEPWRALVVYDLGGVGVRIVVQGGYDRAEAELVAGGLRRAATASADRPETWSPALTG